MGIDEGIEEKIIALHARITTLAAVSCAQPKRKEEVWISGRRTFQSQLAACSIFRNFAVPSRPEISRDYELGIWVTGSQGIAGYRGVSGV